MSPGTGDRVPGSPGEARVPGTEAQEPIESGQDSREPGIGDRFTKGPVARGQKHGPSVPGKMKQGARVPGDRGGSRAWNGARGPESPGTRIWG